MLHMAVCLRVTWTGLLLIIHIVNLFQCGCLWQKKVKLGVSIIFKCHFFSYEVSWSCTMWNIAITLFAHNEGS